MKRGTSWARGRCSPPGTTRIFWVDILSHFLYRYSLADSSVKAGSCRSGLAWAVERRNRPGFIAGLQSGFYELDLEPFALRQIADPEPQ